MGISGWEWTISNNVDKMVHTSFTFMNIALKYVSAADDATNFKMVQRVKIAPLSVMSSPSLGTEPRNKWPDGQLLEFFADS